MVDSYQGFAFVSIQGEAFLWSQMKLPFPNKRRSVRCSGEPPIMRRGKAFHIVEDNRSSPNIHQNPLFVIHCFTKPGSSDNLQIS